MKTRDINKKYIRLLKEHHTENLRDTENIKRRLKEDADKFNTLPVEFLNVPKIITREIHEDFKRISDITYLILTKIIKGYLADKEYRRIFGFSPLTEQLILSHCGYEALLPIVRIDVFYNEDNGAFKFCEFNSDGSSGMAEEMDIADGLSTTHAYKNMEKEFLFCRYNLYEGFIDEFLKIYDSYENKVANPVIAITDFLESGVSNEFEVFRERFEARGYKCVIADIRDLKFVKEKLMYKGEVIDAVYRRAVTGEMEQKKYLIPDFIKAVLSGKVCVIGHIRTQVAHVKVLFAIMRDKMTQKLLTDEENEFIKKHIPFTAELTSGDYNYNEVLADKDRWVIKPSDKYASKDVVLGVEVTHEKWKETLAKGVKNRYLLQEFIKPYKSENCYYDGDKLIEGNFGNIIGLYIYNGKFSGIFTRAGQRATISAQSGGFSLGSIFIEGNKLS